MVLSPLLPYLAGLGAVPLVVHWNGRCSLSRLHIQRCAFNNASPLHLLDRISSTVRCGALQSKGCLPLMLSHSSTLPLFQSPSPHPLSCNGCSAIPPATVCPLHVLLLSLCLSILLARSSPSDFLAANQVARREVVKVALHAMGVSIQHHCSQAIPILSSMILAPLNKCTQGSSLPNW